MNAAVCIPPFKSILHRFHQFRTDPTIIVSYGLRHLLPLLPNYPVYTSYFIYLFIYLMEQVQTRTRFVFLTIQTFEL